MSQLLKTLPDTAALRAPKAAGMATAHTKLATDSPACLPTGATLVRESGVDSDFIMAIRMSTVIASGAKCSMLATAMGYVTYGTHAGLLCKQLNSGISVS